MVKNINENSQKIRENKSVAKLLKFFMGTNHLKFNFIYVFLLRKHNDSI